MTTQNAPESIPEDFADLLGSRALARVTTIGPRGEPQCNLVWFGRVGEHFEFRYLGVHPYQNHRPGDERVVVFVRAEHTTRKDG